MTNISTSIHNSDSLYSYSGNSEVYETLASLIIKNRCVERKRDAVEFIKSFPVSYELQNTPIVQYPKSSSKHFIAEFSKIAYMCHPIYECWKKNYKLQLESGWMELESECTVFIQKLANASNLVIFPQKDLTFSFFSNLPISDIVHILNLMYAEHSVNFTSKKAVKMLELTIQMLQESGVNINNQSYGKDSDSLFLEKNMLALAIERGYKKVASALVNSGADVNYQCASSGNTILMQLMLDNSLDAVKMLIKFKPDPFVENNRKNTALEFAQNHYKVKWNKELVETLAKYVKEFQKDACGSNKHACALM